MWPHPHRTYEGFTPGNDGIPGLVDESHQLWETLLFDLRRDPGERYNVLGQYPEMVEKLNRMAAEARTDLGDDLIGAKGLDIRPCGLLEE